MGHRRKPLWMCTMYVRTLALVLIEEYQYQYVLLSHNKADHLWRKCSGQLYIDPV